MRRVAVLLVAVLALLSLAAPAAGDRPSGGDDDRGHRALSMMTYSIHHAQGADDRLDLDRIAGVIRGQDVQVVGLQEVDRHWSERSEFVDQALYLARELGMQVVYGANLDQDPLTPGAPRRQYGTAILSRYPILESENTLLPKLGTSKQGGLLEALINVRGTRYRFYNPHLQHNSPNADSGQAQRTMQVEAIVDEMREERGPHALVGDLNAEPAAPELQPLYTRLVDAWTAGGIGTGSGSRRRRRPAGSTTCSSRATPGWRAPTCRRRSRPTTCRSWRM